MKLKQDTSDPDVRVEIIPLIDVIFCILTFFILAALSLTRQSAINVDLPRAATGVTQMREMLIVSVDQIGQTYIDRQPVTREQLQQALVDYQQNNPEGLMVLYASRSSSYNDVVGVLDQLRSVGGDRVALATLPDSTQDTQTLPPNQGGFNDPFAVPGSGLPGTGLPGTGLPGTGLPGTGTPGSTLPGTLDPFDPNQNLFPGSQPLPAPSGTSPTTPTTPSTKPSAAPPAAQD
jgi:biopolymer transport protein ExbD